MKLALASFHSKTNHGPHTSLSAELSKVLIRVNPLAFGVGDEFIYRRNYSELIKEWVSHLAKAT